MSNDHAERDALRQRFSDTPPMPDEVLRSVLERVPETPQQRRRWGPNRPHAPVTSAPPPLDLQPEAVTATSGSGPASRGGAWAVFGVMRFVAATAVIAVVASFFVLEILSPDGGELLPGAASPSPVSTTPPTRTEDPDDPMAPAASPSMGPSASLIEAEPGLAGAQVEPGVDRIISDGTGFDTTDLGDQVYVFDDIATGPDGEVWVVARRYDTRTGRTYGPFAFEVGNTGQLGAESGFPADPVKLVVDTEGTPLVAAADGIRAFDGVAWVDSPGSRRIDTGYGEISFIEPEDQTGGEGTANDILVLGSDLAGYSLGEDVGRRLIGEDVDWWESCGTEPLDQSIYRHGGTGCRRREDVDERGVGVERSATNDPGLFLDDQLIGRIARASDGAIWVLSGPPIEALWTGRSSEGSAIYRIDPEAPGLMCHDC